MNRIFATCIAGVLAMHSGSAAAQSSACWDGSALAAARIMEFREIGLAVQLRCRLIGADLASSYAGVLDRYHTQFDVADGAIKAHYHADQGRAQWLDYQRYITHVTNIYGGGATTMTVCQTFASVLGELAAPVAPSGALDTVVAAMVKSPHVDAAACEDARAVRP